MKTQLVATIEELFSKSNQGFFIWISSEGKKYESISKLHRTPYCNQLIEMQDELSGFTALTAPGMLKRICIVDSETVVSKSSVNRSISVVQNEVIASINATVLFRNIRLERAIENFRIQTVPILAVIKANGVVYALMCYSPFPTLDEILICNPNRQSQKAYLEKLKTLFEVLYSRGFYWRDLAPRNILVDETRLMPTLIVLDFEKSGLVKDIAMPLEVFWRGSVISEEIASLCYLDVILDVFSDYYQPSTWCTNNESIELSSFMRREVKDILMNDDSLMTRHNYNSLDRKLIEIRGPIEDSFGKIYFPGKYSFIFDHILGPIIDRKVNELFLAAKIEGRFIEEVKFFYRLLFDNGIKATDFVSSSNSGVSEVDLDSIEHHIQERSRNTNCLNIIRNFLEGQ